MSSAILSASASLRAQPRRIRSWLRSSATTRSLCSKSESVNWRARCCAPLYPRRSRASIVRWSARSPTCQSPVPALVDPTRSRRPAASANPRKTTSAMTDRQMLPVHTKTTRKGSTAVEVMGSIFSFPARGSTARPVDVRSPPGHRGSSLGHEASLWCAEEAHKASASCARQGGPVHQSIRPPVFLAAGALVLASLVAAQPAAAVVGTDLILSEVIEGTSNNKAVEIYNPTASAVPLAGYDLVQYTNGSTTATTLATLTGTLGSGAVFVVASASANDAIKAQADALSSAGMFNGDDAIALRKNGTAIDVFGQIGFDPGSFWGTGDNITQDRTLRREAAVCSGDPVGSDVFDPTVGWDTYPTDTIADLGMHTSLCEVNPDPDPDPEPDPDPVADCALDAATIGALQGPGDSTPVPNTVVRVEGVVVGDFQTGGFDGYYVQDAGDGDPGTSDGIFIYQNDADNTPGNGDGILDVSVGDVVHVVGTI